MIKGVEVKKTFKYVSTKDVDKDNPTVFVIGTVDPFVKAYIEDATTSFNFGANQEDGEYPVKIEIARRTYLTVKHGVRRIENLLDPETQKPVEDVEEVVGIEDRQYPVLSSKVLDMLPQAVIAELAGVINRFSETGVEELAEV